MSLPEFHTPHSRIVKALRGLVGPMVPDEDVNNAATLIVESIEELANDIAYPRSAEDE